MPEHPNMTSSPDYEMLKKNKIVQREAKDALLTEKLLLQEAQENKDTGLFGKKEKLGVPFQLVRFLWSIMPQLFGLGALLAIFIGFRLREYEYFTAEEGTGYALGIIGGCMMLALLLYPLRKRFRILRIIGDVRAWFGLHMALGIMGPVLILFHANFSMGSTNSNVALISMVIVSLSGVIGRYIYTRIHHGLYGQKIELAQLKDRLDNNQQEVAALLHLSPEIKSEIFEFTDHILAPTKGLLHSWARILSVGIRTRFLIRKVRKAVQQDLRRNMDIGNWSRKEMRTRVDLIVNESGYFIRRARKVVEFNFYERMFALWHVLHLPLFFMLVMAAIVHVIAVHWY